MEDSEADSTTNTLQMTKPTLQELSQHVTQCSDTVACLTMLRGVPNQAKLRCLAQQQRGRRLVCWECREHGHIQRNCLQWQHAKDKTHVRKEWSGNKSSAYKLKAQIFSSILNSLATGASLLVDGYIGAQPTKMLVDTGSAVTTVQENVWREAAGNGDQPIWMLPLVLCRCSEW